jgi:ectoine hydroxylase-related dioxygenase (phytanoyl-CoA dioxygenase family)
VVFGGLTPTRRPKDGDYRVFRQEREAFAEEGWVRLPGVLAEEELSPFRADFERFRRGEIPVPGRDYCDMAQGYRTAAADFAVVNVMLPRRWLPSWRGNLYEQRAAAIARQLAGRELELDYDQLLAKRPGAADARFAWHQDLAYWPMTPDPFTVTCWLALDDADEENGCLRFVVGSHREERLRPHRPLHGDREQSHTLVAEVDEARDRIVSAPARAGDVLAFRERLLHGSGGNRSASSWRRAYVAAFRTPDTIARERAIGFTHSHEDSAAARAAVAAMRPETVA